MTGQPEHLRFFSTPALDEHQKRAWCDLAQRVPWAHYRQDPAWAEIERYGSGTAAREPRFFWVEAEGSMCLTAIAVRRLLPVPGYAFWEFNRGPTFLENGVLDQWLPWLLSHIGRSAARIRMDPPVPLLENGGDVNTILEQHGFTRHEDWSTLLVDLSAEEDEVIAGFRSTTKQSIKRSRSLGVVVQTEDAPDGWRTISTLQAELALRAPVPSVDELMMERISRNWLRGGSGGTVLVASHQGDPLAAALIVTYRNTAHLVVMPSARRQRDIPASHLLLWEAMRWSRAHECTVFDLGGYSLEAQEGDSLWGVNLFKRGFSSLDNLVTSVGAHEAVPAPTVVALARLTRTFQSRVRRLPRNN
jgi:hypothetical protein